LPSFLLAAPLVASTDLVAVLPEPLARLMDDAFDIFPLPFMSIRFNVRQAENVKFGYGGFFPSQIDRFPGSRTSMPSTRQPLGDRATPSPFLPRPPGRECSCRTD
jgi:hypothetical protein